MRTLEASGYRGWYVLEQDVVLQGPDQSGAPFGDVRTSLDFLLRIAG